VKYLFHRKIFILLGLIYINPVYSGSTPIAGIEKDQTLADTITESASNALHSLFDQVLNEHVIDGRVNYAGINTDPRFRQYLNKLKQADPDSYTNKEEKLVFWINAYNALAIKGILDGLSPSSFFGRISFFKTTDYEVGGKTINLYDLERDIIIPFGEPRIHFAIICASMSCPKLRSEAYIKSSLHEQLDENTKSFINNQNRNQFDVSKKRAKLSKIFDWFDQDFKKHSGSVQKYIAQYIIDPEVGGLLRKDGFEVKHLKYDWSLNGMPVEQSITPAQQ